jgi:hypothetical protein
MTITWLQLKEKIERALAENGVQDAEIDYIDMRGWNHGEGPRYTSPKES